jgi:hypothetical protein
MHLKTVKNATFSSINFACKTHWHEQKLTFSSDLESVRKKVSFNKTLKVRQV